MGTKAAWVVAVVPQIYHKIESPTVARAAVLTLLGITYTVLNNTSSLRPIFLHSVHKFFARYQLLCELVDNMVNQSFMIRSVLGLPEREMVEDTSHEEGKKYCNRD